jgi:GNAT superfamily N-acetyltransferase
MSINQLPHKWETRRLEVKDSTLDEAQELQQINDAFPALRGWTDEKVEGESVDSILFVLREGMLPPNGSKEFFRLQSIRLSHTNQLIGFMGVYHGFPSADVFWLNVLAIRPGFQGKGYGRELVRGLSDVVRQLGTFTHMQMFVSLKHWPALRFWSQGGFDKIVRIVGDKVLADTTHAHVMLEKSLVESSGRAVG